MAVSCCCNAYMRFVSSICLVMEGAPIEHTSIPFLISIQKRSPRHGRRTQGKRSLLRLRRSRSRNWSGSLVQPLPLLIPKAETHVALATGAPLNAPVASALYTSAPSKHATFTSNVVHRHPPLLVGVFARWDHTATAVRIERFPADGRR